MTPEPDSPDSIDNSPSGEARRRFLLKCGRFAVVTPPAMAMLLSVGAMPRQAQAASGFGGWDDDDDGDNKHDHKHKYHHKKKDDDGGFD